MRITYVARRAWPALSGMENYLRLMSEALPPLERVQLLTATTVLGENAFVAPFGREAFTPFTRGQVSTEPLRVLVPYVTRHRRTALFACFFLALAAVTTAVAAAAGAGPFDDADAGSPEAQAARDATYGADRLRTDSGIPVRYRRLIVDTGTSCAEPGITPALVAAMLKAESNFDPDLSDPQKDEYGIARWTPDVLRYYLPEGQRDADPVPPFPPEMSIPAVGRYLCHIAPRVADVPGDRGLLLAAGYRTSAARVVESRGTPPKYAGYVAEVAKYRAMYEPDR